MGGNINKILAILTESNRFNNPCNHSQEPIHRSRTASSINEEIDEEIDKKIDEKVILTEVECRSSLAFAESYDIDYEIKEGFQKKLTLSYSPPFKEFPSQTQNMTIETNQTNIKNTTSKIKKNDPYSK